MFKEILSLASLFFFTMASGGFVFVMIRYPLGSSMRTWGIRASHVLGFLGVVLMRLARGSFTEASLLVISALIVSLVSFEMTRKYLKP